MNELEFHEVAGIFPLLGDEELNELARDIRANGLREAIWTYQGKIVDGRNRYRACKVAEVQPAFREWDGQGSVAAFSVSLNLRRRHLNESQRAMVAAKLANMDLGSNQHGAGAANLPTLPELEAPPVLPRMSQKDASELLNVSERSLRAAKEVQRDAAPELIAAVEQGEVAVSTAATVTALPKEEQVQLVARGEREILAAAKEIRNQKTEVRRTERLQKIEEITANNADLNEGIGKFPVLYVDPPWRYEHAESESRAIENQYPTMTLEDICALPVGDIALDDAIMFLWGTSPKLAEAMQVISAWGFTYRTCMVWDKEKIGMGYYARQQHELLLICTRGALPAPPPPTRPSSVYREARSSKPTWFYEMIEVMYPTLAKVELFCRSPREGWKVWGNQSA